ncbi:MAG: thioredoxin family protein [Wenzhouxiangellaceae bacterium]|nr:thioredoxin family protein [Wenzhouxiangellaceae bacterium]
MKPLIQSLFFALAAALAFFFSPPLFAQTQPSANAGEPQTLYVFKSSTCPHCQQQKPFLEALDRQHPGLQVRRLEIMSTNEHHDLLRALSDAHGVTPGSVPMVFFGGKVWVGDSPQIRAEISRHVEKCMVEQCPQAQQAANAVAEKSSREEPRSGDAEINIPLLGAIDLNGHSLLFSTILIAFVDGFNPCSLWLLSMLIALVLHSGSRRRVVVVGLTFLTVTALVYGLFITGVFSVLAYARYLPWMYWAVALFALVFGLVNIKDYFWFGKGLSFTIDEKHKPGIYQKFRSLMINQRSLPALAAATALMASGIALIELPCTAGFPVIWSGLVNAQQVGTTGFLALLAVYLVIYLADELVIFSIAAVKLRIDRFQQGQARVLKLIGGVIMITLAVVLVSAPEIMSQAGTAIGIFMLAFALAGLVFVVHRQVLPRLGLRLGDGWGDGR